MLCYVNKKLAGWHSAGKQNMSREAPWTFETQSISCDTSQVKPLPWKSADKKQHMRDDPWPHGIHEAAMSLLLNVNLAFDYVIYIYIYIYISL